MKSLLKTIGILLIPAVLWAGDLAQRFPSGTPVEVMTPSAINSTINNTSKSRDNSRNFTADQTWDVNITTTGWLSAGLNSTLGNATEYIKIESWDSTAGALPGLLDVPLIDFINTNAISLPTNIGAMNDTLFLKGDDNTTLFIMSGYSPFLKSYASFSYDADTAVLTLNTDSYTDEVNIAEIYFHKIYNPNSDAYYPIISGQSNDSNTGIMLNNSVVLWGESGDPILGFRNNATNVTTLLTINENGLYVLGGILAVKEDAGSTGLKEAFTGSGKLFGGSAVGEETALLFKDGADTGLGGNKPIAAVASEILANGTNWKGGLNLYTFEYPTNSTPILVANFTNNNINLYGNVTAEESYFTNTSIGLNSSILTFDPTEEKLAITTASDTVYIGTYAGSGGWMSFGGAVGGDTDDTGLQLYIPTSVGNGFYYGWLGNEVHYFSNDLIVGDTDQINVTTVTTDGGLILTGSARVYQNEWIDVDSFSIPGTKPATKVEWGIASGWEFTDGTDDTIYSVKRLPQDMDKTDAPQFKLGWASDTADPGDSTKYVQWQLEYKYFAPNENTTDAAQETLYCNSTASTTGDGLTIATFTGMDLPDAADQLMFIRIKRQGAWANDTLGDDATVLGAGLRYTKDKLGQPM